MSIAHAVEVSPCNGSCRLDGICPWLVSLQGSLFVVRTKCMLESFLSRYYGVLYCDEHRFAFIEGSHPVGVYSIRYSFCVGGVPHLYVWVDKLSVIDQQSPL